MALRPSLCLSNQIDDSFFFFELGNRRIRLLKVSNFMGERWNCVLEIVAICIEEFNSRQDDLSVSVTGCGTGVGIKSLANGITDIAMASREVKAEKVVIYGDRFVPFPIAIDAFCIAVSRDVREGGVREISRDQLFSIYNGEIDSWMDLGGPDEPIEVVAREDGSGTRDVFNEIVMGRRDHGLPGRIRIGGATPRFGRRSSPAKGPSGTSAYTMQKAMIF